VKAGTVEIDPTPAGEARRELVPVTRTECLLLQHLASNAGKVILNAELLSKVWGPEYRDDLQYLRVWVSRLRHKLEPEPGNPTIIKTLPGIGYMFDAEPAQPKAAAQASSAGE
jgi:two-component system KDP operon response regulator KdpE